MADDQVKYSELLVKDEDVFANLIKELGDVKTKISELKTEASGLSGVLKNISTATREQQQATAANAKSVEALSQKTKELVTTKKNLEDATKRFGNLTDEEVGRLDRLATKLKFSSQWQEATAKLIDTTNMSYNEMKATLAVLTNALHTFGLEEKKNSDEAKALENAIERVRDAMKELDDRTKAVAAAEKQMAEEAKKAAKEEEAAYKVSQKEAEKRVKTQEDLHNARQKEIEDAFKARDAEMAKMKLTEEEYNSVKQLKAALAGTTQEQIAAVQAIDMQNMSYNELYQTYNAIKEALKAMSTGEWEVSEAGKVMTAQSAKIYDTMNELQKATGKYTLQVGKYRAAFDGLGYSFQQILREAPSALNLNQFFLAISNNIPMFLDQLKSYKAEQAEIKANLDQMTKGTKEYAEQQEKVVSVGKKLGQVLISWQSLVLVGLMIIRNWNKIVSGITSLFSNLTKEQKTMKTVSEAAASTIGELTAKYESLRTEWQNLKAEDQGEWLEKHKNDWLELGYSIDDAKKAEDFYVNNTAAVQEAIDKRAKAIAGMKLAAEKYEEAFKKQVEAEQGKNSRQTSFWSQMARSLASAGQAEATGTLTEEQMASRDRAEEQAIESLYQKRMKKVKELQDEAREYLSFVDDKSINAPKGSGKTKEPKDQVDDLLTLQRQLEDAIIDNIENEFEREEAAEIARHQRFIEDKQKELELVKGDAERTAVINQQIEEEQNTHDNNMLDIDEKYRQQIIKGIEEQKKAEEQAAKEAERLAKEKITQEEKDFKAHQEIDKRRFELTKHTATEEKKFVMQQQMEFLQWRIDHAAALGISKDMLEVMKREYEEMFRQFQAGNYSTGKQNIQGNYGSVLDILFPGWDADKKNALNSVFDQAKEALNSWMDARKAAADQAKELADDEVSAAENALNREIELRNQGYANDVALRERELADAKEMQKKAAEEQKKIAQQQILLDAALQASSMITASANIIKQFPNPLAWGPMLAVMWGAYGYAKLKAYQEAGNVKLYREGGSMLLEGGSHESGHDVNLGIGPDGSNLRAEGGEYFAVINKRSSRKYGSEIPAVVNALNSGMFEDRYIKTSDAVGLLPRTIIADNGSAVDLSAVESGVDQLVKQGESRWTVEGEYRVERYKNRVRRVKIS